MDRNASHAGPHGRDSVNRVIKTTNRVASDEEISRTSSCGSIGEPVKPCASIIGASTAFLPPRPRSIETRVGNRQYIDIDTVGTLSRGDYCTVVGVISVS